MVDLLLSFAESTENAKLAQCAHAVKDFPQKCFIIWQ
jgi:hypothetical protein